MLTFAILLAVQVAAPAAPSTEATALGMRLAETGTLAALLPMMVAKDTADMVTAHPELSAAEQAELKATAARVAEAGKTRVMTAMAGHYATSLSLPDLKALVSFQESPAARRYRAAQTGAIAATMQAMAGVDLKRDTYAAFCAQTGKLCAAK